MPSSATTTVPSSLVTSASSRESMNRTVATSLRRLDQFGLNVELDRRTLATRFDEDRQRIGVVCRLFCANHRTIVSYTAPARTSGFSGEGDEQAARTKTIAASTTLRPRTATSTFAQYHPPVIAARRLPGLSAIPVEMDADGQVADVPIARTSQRAAVLPRAQSQQHRLLDPDDCSVAAGAINERARRPMWGSPVLSVPADARARCLGRCHRGPSSTSGR